MDNTKRARVIALYLPQYHPVAENDKYWGKGFTEWTNVAKAKPLFHGHYQPRIPADLGFYDLRIPQVREAQAELAREAGIEGFCYWHYWFGNGKEVLQMPFDEVIRTGKPDFPFCLGWALHDWTTKTWEKGSTIAKDTMIFKQEFPGEEDDIKHFYRLLNAFKDKRYIKVDGKLLFSILVPRAMPEPKRFMELWNRLAEENGLPGFHFVGIIDSMPPITRENINNIDEAVENNVSEIKALGFDAVGTTDQKYAELKTGGKLRKVIFALVRKVFPGALLDKYNYSKIIDNFYSPSDRREDVYPQLLAGWDRSPRSGRKAIIYFNNTPETFAKAAEKAIDCVKNKKPEHRIIFLNSWNEWGEGAYMEPDLKYGKGKIQKLRDALRIVRGDIE